jgi:hypothetical protein
MTNPPPIAHGAAAPALDPADEAMLERLQRAAFGYFEHATNPENGLVADNSRPGSPASIAACGFALSAYPVAVKRGWISHAAAVNRCLATARFFEGSDQSGSVDATGCHGFYFHFLDMHSGLRAWRCELSSIDTAMLVAGLLTAAAYFDGATAEEAELRGLAQRLYERVDWRWAQHGSSAVVLGWKPECGFLNYGWQGYNEAMLLYVLGLGSPTHALDADSFEAWTMTYQWENLYGMDFLYAGPLFEHQFSQAWIDLRGIRDGFMREKSSDYFENSRRAVHIQREYAIRNPRGFADYGQDCWGLSAGEGPSVVPQQVAGRRQAFYGYCARGVPWGPDDGTITGSSIVASLVFAPEIALPALRRMYVREPGEGRRVLASGWNATAEPSAAGSGRATPGWISEGEFALDQGMTVLMIENFISGEPWRVVRGVACVRAGLERAGFTGGWLHS